MVSILDFNNFDIRVGKILTAEVHEAARKPMYKLTIDLGPEIGVRNIVAGIAVQYTKEELIGMLVVCIVNLDPKIIAGAESQGMILAAGDEEKISILTPIREIAVGSRVR